MMPQIKRLKSLVCLLYGKKSNKINVVKYDKFKEVYETQNKIQDLALLPPFQQSVQLHFKRSNYVARIWRSCLTAVIDFPNISEHGRTNSGSIVWTILKMIMKTKWKMIAKVEVKMARSDYF